MLQADTSNPEETHYTWLRNGRHLPSTDQVYTIKNNILAISGPITAKLNGIYSCVVENQGVGIEYSTNDYALSIQGKDEQQLWQITAVH